MSPDLVGTGQLNSQQPAEYTKVKFKYSEKNTKFCEISTNYLTGCTYDKWLVEIAQNFAAFSEYMNFNKNSM